jgi:hypothetical protein
MKQTASIGAIFAVALILVLELAGAGAYVVTSAHADPNDACFGYAICK